MQSVARLYRSPGRKSGRQGDEHVPLGDPSDATKADDLQIVSNLNAATGAWTWVSSDNDTVVGLGVKPTEQLRFRGASISGRRRGRRDHSVVAGAGSTRLIAVTDWARAHGVQMFLAEFGSASDSASMAEGKALNDFTHANSDVWLSSRSSLMALVRVTSLISRRLAS